MLLKFDAWLELIRKNGTLKEKEQAAVIEFLDVQDNAMTFIEAIDAGLSLPHQVTIPLRWRDNTFKHLSTIHWGELAAFADDDVFTNTRFQIATMYWNGNLQGALWQAAGNQYIRMLQAGRLDMRYMDGYTSAIIGGRDGELSAWSAAHNAEIQVELEEGIIRAEQNPGGYMPNYLEHLQGVLGRADQIRNQAYVERWLQTALDPDEYAAIRDMNHVILRELYPHVWLGGYEKYRARISQQLVPL